MCRKLISTSLRLPLRAFGPLRKRTCPTTEFDGDGVSVDGAAVLPRARKEKSRPELATTTISRAIKNTRILRCLTGGCDAVGRTTGGDTWEGCTGTPVGVVVPGFWNIRFPGLLSAGAVKGVCLSFAEGETWNENGVMGVGVIPTGWEGCSGLYEYALLISGVALGLLSSTGTAMLKDSATAMVMAVALE